MPLRACYVCGLEAHTEEDLELFVKHKSSCYGRRNLCKKCMCERVKECRYRPVEFTNIFRARSPNGIIRCYFCENEVTKLLGRDRDSLANHSLDGNHENWDSINKVPAHFGCHISFHNTGEGHGRWLDEPSDDTKYMREWRRRRKQRSILLVI